MATNNPREPRTYPAEKARQGEIILRSRASRIIFIAGSGRGDNLGGGAVVVLFSRSLTGVSRDGNG